MDVSRAEDQLLSCSSDSTVKRWDLDDGAELETLQFHDSAVPPPLPPLELSGHAASLTPY